MTIHTFEVSCTVPKEKSGMTYWGLSDKGIIIRTLIIIKNGYYAYNITYRISARRVMDNHDFVGLFNTKKYKELEKEVDILLYCKCELLPFLKDCKMKRIDMCEYHSENKDILKKFIEFSNRFRSAAKAIILYKEFFDRKKVSRILWMLPI